MLPITVTKLKRNRITQCGNRLQAAQPGSISSRFVTILQRPDRLSGPSSFLSYGYQEFFPED
jgi:hypothetical protein